MPGRRRGALMKIIAAILCSAAALCGAAFAQTPERQALLSRLDAAIPPRQRAITLDAAPAYQALRTRLLAAHPDRAADIEASFAGMISCLGERQDALAHRMLTAAVDAQMTDAEIERLDVFYEGGDYPRLMFFVATLQSSPNLPPADERAWAQQVMTRPEIVKFGNLVIQVGRDGQQSPDVQAIFTQCGDAAMADLRAHGLTE